MEIITQSIEEILANLQPLAVEWRDDTAQRVINRLRDFPVKDFYTAQDLLYLLDHDFDDGMLIIRLFLGLSKDQFATMFRDVREPNGTGLKSFRADRIRFVEDLITLGSLEAITLELKREMHWSDVLVERLRSGRGSAISGQKRGRGVEDFAEAIIGQVFDSGYDVRCTFDGPRGSAKCDFAIPSRTTPRILIETKGYGATGSKMTDVIGDIEQIIRTKRADTAFLFFTDGLTWKQRKSDLRKIVEHQNSGGITRIYTIAMAARFESDLRQLKVEFKL